MAMFCPWARGASKGGPPPERGFKVPRSSRETTLDEKWHM